MIPHGLCGGNIAETGSNFLDTARVFTVLAFVHAARCLSLDVFSLLLVGKIQLADLPLPTLDVVLANSRGLPGLVGCKW